MKTYKRTSVFTELPKFDALADPDAYLEITEWENGEGFSAVVSSYDEKRFEMTYGEFDALKKAVKAMYKVINQQEEP